jgi:hypothetical protein
VSENNGLGELVIDPFADSEAAEKALLEVARLLACGDFLLQVGFSPRTRQHVMVLAKVTDPGKALAIAEVMTINPNHIEYRLLGAGALPKKRNTLQ